MKQHTAMRRDRRRRLLRRRFAAWMARGARAASAGALVAAASGVAALALPAAASAGAITLQSTYAGPIAATNQLCTAEPRALLYGTTNFDPLRPLTHRSHGYPDITVYDPANAPSALDLSPAIDAGGRTDLCLGFTLPPNVEPALVRDWFNDAPRLQDDPAWPDHAETHVSSYPLGSNPVQGDDLRTLTATLPAGYSIDFAAAARCTDAAFGVGSHASTTCPVATRVGDAFLRVNSYAAGEAKHATLTNAALYNLAPAPGELGRLGLTAQADPVLAPSKWVFSVRLAPDGSGRLMLQSGDAPRSAYDQGDIGADGDAWDGDGDDILLPGDPRIGQPQPGAPARPLYLESVGLRPWGAKAAHATLAADFGTWGTRCESALSVTLGATTYAGTGSSATTDAFTLADCGALALPAATSAVTTSREAGAATGATARAEIDQVGARAPAVPTRVAVTLPDGLELGPQLASGSEGQPNCSAAQFGTAAPQAPSACPPAAAIGSAELRTPLAQAPFTGTLYLAPPPTPDVLAGVFVDLALASPVVATAPRLKLAGTLAVDDAGRVTIALDDLPDLRFDALQVTLRGGPHALLTNPRTCATHVGGATLERGAVPPTTAASALTIDEACGAPGLAPTLEVAPSTARSAGRAATSLALSRADRTTDLEQATFTLPSGVLLVPGSIPECSAEGAAAGDCPAATQVGLVRVRAGSGSDPAELAGELFLAPTPEGAFAGGVIVVPVRLGVVELGAIVAPVRFDLRSAATLAMTVSLPGRLRGVRLDLRRLTVDLDREGVVRQPTACGPLGASATVSGGGREASTAATVTYGGCGALPFDPGFAASASGESAVGGHPRVTIALTARGGDGALRSAAITLPAGLALDPARTASPCSLDAFHAGTCDAASKVGQAGGKVAIAPDALGGDAVLVRLPGEARPGLGLTLAGRFGHRVLGRFATDSTGRLVLTFPALVDLPLSRLAVAFDGGSAGALRMVPAACPSGTAWNADLVGHGGQTAQRQVAAACRGGQGTSTAESPVAALSLSAKTGLKLKLTQFGDLQLQAAKLTLPKLMRLDAPKAKRGGRTSLALIGAKATPIFTRGSLTLTTYGGAPTEVVVRVRTTAYTLSGTGAAVRKPAKRKAPKATAKAAAAGTASKKKPAKKAKTATFQLRLAFKDGSVQTRAIKVKLP